MASKGKAKGAAKAKKAPAKKAAPKGKKAAPKSAAPKKAAPKGKKPARAGKAAKPAMKSAKAAPAKAAKPIEAKKPVPTPPKKPTLLTPKNSVTKQYSQSELYDSIQGYCGFNTRREAREFYDNFAGLVQAALKSGFKVVLPGLGKIQVRKTKPRKGINPATRQVIHIPAKRKVAFTALKTLKEAVL